MKSVVGVLAIQGDFERHISVLDHIGRSCIEVRSQVDLERVDRLIIPGGESTTVGKLLDRFGLGLEIVRRARQGMPIWGTCMGMIMLADRVKDKQQYSLGLLPIEVERNAFGAQIHSFEAHVPFLDWNPSVEAVFIRAPVVTEWNSEVEILARFEKKVVAVRHGNILGTSFHPELTLDSRIHTWFCEF